MELTMLNSLPIRTATDASPTPSRVPTHGSRRNVDGSSFRFSGLSPPILCQLAWRTIAFSDSLLAQVYRVEPKNTDKFLFFKDIEQPFRMT